MLKESGGLLYVKRNPPISINNIKLKRKRSRFEKMAKAKMTKQDYYETMVRNRYYLWAYSSNVCTMDNLDDVKEGRQYAPVYDEVHLEPCPRPPLKQFVLKEIRAELAIKERQRLRELQQAQAHGNGHGQQHN
jgi:hypothetical protein